MPDNAAPVATPEQVSIASRLDQLDAALSEALSNFQPPEEGNATDTDGIETSLDRCNAKAHQLVVISVRVGRL